MTAQDKRKSWVLSLDKTHFTAVCTLIWLCDCWLLHPEVHVFHVEIIFIFIFWLDWFRSPGHKGRHCVRVHCSLLYSGTQDACMNHSSMLLGMSFLMRFDADVTPSVHYLNCRRQRVKKYVLYLCIISFLYSSFLAFSNLAFPTPSTTVPHFHVLHFPPLQINKKLCHIFMSHIFSIHQYIHAVLVVNYWAAAMYHIAAKQYVAADKFIAVRDVTRDIAVQWTNKFCNSFLTAWTVSHRHLFYHILSHLHCILFAMLMLRPIDLY